MSSSPDRTRYPHSMHRSLVDDAAFYDAVLSAAISVEETVSLIMGAARAGNWKEAASLYHEILKPRSHELQGTAGYGPDDHKTDLLAIEDGFALHRLDELEQALEAMSGRAFAARSQAEDESPGEEGNDWYCLSI